MIYTFSGKITGDASYLLQATGTDTSRLISDVHFDMTGALLPASAGITPKVIATAFRQLVSPRPAQWQRTDKCRRRRPCGPVHRGRSHRPDAGR
jgi:hypothetical protein